MQVTPDSGPPATPWWVKAIALVALILLLVVLAVALMGGDHGPGMH